MKKAEVGSDRFFIVGAMRSGTTYAATVLDEHPDICMARPLLPEPKFFLKEDLYGGGRERYEALFFSHRNTEKVFGEKTVHYCEREDALRRMAEWYPGAKIIFMARDPVRRALSNYFFSRKNGLETRTLDEVFMEAAPPPEYDRGRFFISPFDYLRRGLYAERIAALEQYFPKDRIGAIISERFTGNLEEVRRLYEFLGVDGSITPPSLGKMIYSTGVDAGSVDEKIVSALKDYYREPNCRLEEHLGEWIPEWEK